MKNTKSRLLFIDKFTLLGKFNITYTTQNIGESQINRMNNTHHIGTVVSTWRARQIEKSNRDLCTLYLGKIRIATYEVSSDYKEFKVTNCRVNSVAGYYSTELEAKEACQVLLQVFLGDIQSRQGQ